jgi:16S rRNA (uracil1498-N3)-methyltransferase
VTIRLFVDAPLREGAGLALPPGAARHAQVRRVQPGDALVLFDGGGCDWPATVLAMGRNAVRVQVGTPVAVANELPWPVTVAFGAPANDRMDLVVEKATELGVTRIQPLFTERSVLRTAGDRAARKRAHWQAVAEAACEQCGRARVPLVAPLVAFADWLDTAPAAGPRWLLSLAPAACPIVSRAGLLPIPAGSPITILSGPEGGLTPAEESAAQRCGFALTALGPRVLRADTAPLAVLAWLALNASAQTPVDSAAASGTVAALPTRSA